LGTRTPSASSDEAISRESPDKPNRLWRLMRWPARFAFPVWFRLRARGLEKIPSHGPALLVINHQSHLDSMLVGTPMDRPISYLARDSLFRVPIVGWILKNSYAMPVNRESASSSSLRLAADRLKKGFLVGIFPEGTRSSDGKIGPLKPGFIALVRKADVPIIPVGVAGSRAAMPRGAWFVRPKTCRVVFGDPIPLELLSKLVVKGNEQALLDEVRQRMSQCQAEAQEWLSR
jgi:1-acyl-sn-glycerol-3-phosphate acyltransferase